MDLRRRRGGVDDSRVPGIGDSVGSIEPGTLADLVVLDAVLEVDSVMAGGGWIVSGRLFHT